MPPACAQSGDAAGRRPSLGDDTPPRFSSGGQMPSTFGYRGMSGALRPHRIASRESRRCPVEGLEMSWFGAHHRITRPSNTPSPCSRDPRCRCSGETPRRESLQHPTPHRDTRNATIRRETGQPVSLEKPVAARRPRRVRGRGRGCCRTCRRRARARRRPPPPHRRQSRSAPAAPYPSCRPGLPAGSGR